MVVALNKFSSDSAAEIAAVKAWCLDAKVNFAVNESWAEGSEGAKDLAHQIVSICEKEAGKYHTLVNSNQTILEKLKLITTKVYGGREVLLSETALTQLSKIEELGLDRLNVCVAKTQSSITDDPKLLGRPSNFDLHVRELHISSGAGFIVAICGSMMTMPGLPKIPAANAIDIDDHGKIVGLF